MALDRTASEVRPESELVTASGRLKAKKSVSGSGRSTCSGKPMSRSMRRGAMRSPEFSSVSTLRTASAIAAAFGKRSNGFLRSARWMTSSIPATAADPTIGGGSCVRIFS